MNPQATAKTPRKPKTDHVLVRGNRQSTFGQVHIVTNDGSFDFTDYRYLRMSEMSGPRTEEWVHKDDLKFYKVQLRKHGKV